MADYISRQAALNAVCSDDCEDCPDGGCGLYRQIKKIPAQYENDRPRGAIEAAVSQKDTGTERMPSGAKAPQKMLKHARGRCLERACNYVADFVYVDCATGETVVEDAKGVRTKEYVIKRKLMLWVHHIRIREV